MKTQYNAIPCWSTAANNQVADDFPIDASALRAHIQHCRKPYGHLLGVVCAADAMHGFALSRFVTTLIVVATLIAISSLAI